MEINRNKTCREDAKEDKTRQEEQKNSRQQNEHIKCKQLILREILYQRKGHHKVYFKDHLVIHWF